MVWGIVCEFNPFHRGHRYLIDTIKNKDDAVICVMSGNFVQRGEAAVYDKFTRAKAALEGGADLIIEIPTPCATLSAPGFAKAGVTLLEATGVVDRLAFGAECDDIETLKAAAKAVKDSDEEIRAALANGLSYPAARQQAVGSSLLETPNNILAIEYINCTSLPCTAVKRIGKGHDSDDALYSASEIRKTLNENEIASLKNAERAILYKLRTMSTEDFAGLDDVNEGLENRIAEAVKTAGSLDELYALIKTKRFTHARIRRIILRAFLGIDANTPKTPSALRILGFNEKGRELLTEIKKTATLPIITGYADAKRTGGDALKAFEAESLYTDIYNIMYKAPRPCGTEMTDKIVVV